MADWYYTANGQQAGPVDLPTLRQMLSDGSLPQAELVYGPGLTQWTPAGQVPTLSQGAVAAGAYGLEQASPGAGGASVLGYRGVATDTTGLSGVAMNALLGTKPWVRFISIMAFIGAGFSFLGGISMLLIRGLIGNAKQEGVPAWLGGIYLAGAVLYVIPGVLLTRYANGIGRLMRTQRMSDVEQALGAQKSFWKFCGIMIIIILCVYAIAIVGLVIFKAKF